MTTVIEQFGLAGIEIPALFDEPSYPEPVQGRVAHIDADFIAYQTSAESKEELDGTKPRKSLEDMQNSAREAVNHLMRMSGATSYVCHLTAPSSTKGGRYEQAVQREYQGGRADKAKPENLAALRKFIAHNLNGAVHLDQEADDGLAQANYGAMGKDGSWGDSNLSVIVSQDKDLRMVPGLHYDFDTKAVFCVCDKFGSIWIDDSGSAKKLKGWGTKFFWAQTLMGDTADNIRGIPAVPARMIPGTKGKTLTGGKPCGPVLTYELLKDVQSDKDAFALIKSLWTAVEAELGYTFRHWETAEPVTATQALLADMRLLWMRRDKNPDDVLVWLKEVLA